MVPAASDGGPRAPPYSGSPPRRGPASPMGLSPAAGRRSSRSGPRAPTPARRLLPRAGRNPRGLGCSPFARRYSGNRVCFLFPRLLRCFSSPRSPALSGVPGRRPGGLPHSDTPGSRAVCASPGLFAACRVLHRLQEPGHPPCALPRFPRARAAARPRAPPPRAASLQLLSRLASRSLSLASCRARPPRGGRARRPVPSKICQVENVGFEPTAPGLQSRCSTAELIPRPA